MKRIASLLFALAMTSSAVFADTGANDPAAVTKAAYRTDLADFGFAVDTVQHAKPYLTPGLYAALMKKANQPVAKGDAPDIEGDVLFNAQDVPDKYEVGHATVVGAKAEVPVSLTWGNEKRRYMVRLVQLKSSGAWRIADIDYGEDGTLSGLLR